jgi:catechol 2,3-dioxygenase-like lactoylglutathione lyase family enzyme
MTQRIISGIQQVGIGIPDVQEAWKWYRKYFKMDVAAFDDEGMAEFMLPYTGGKPHARHAILALNMKGGGGFEIWQYKSRKPEASQFEILLGDLGICALKIKTEDIEKTHVFFKSEGLNISDIHKDPAGNSHFFVKDPYGNIFQMVKNDKWFVNNKDLTGGADGVMIGVSDIEKSLRFYNEILGYDKIIYDTQGKHQDFDFIPGGGSSFRRVLLTHSKPRLGAFSKMFGESKIELVQVLDRKPKKIFENRFWGDLGFIHLCFDVSGMESFCDSCSALGHPFTVDSRKKTNGNSFDMGEAAGDFAYIEDPDGTLIELVEAHRIPLVKKLGWNLNLKKRDQAKSLPDWMVKMLGLKRVKD